MGLTEGHWFEDEEPELTERQLEDDISIQDRVYRRGYYKGYSDGAKEKEEQIKNRDESLEKAREEIKWLRKMLKEQEVKTGHWIDSAGNDKCSICGEEYSDLYPDYGNTHFCPNCGAKMEGR